MYLQGDPNASIPTVEPIVMRPMFAVGATRGIFSALVLICPWQTFVPQMSIVFVSKASIETGTVQSYNLRKRIEAVKNCRNIGKKDMKHNEVMPKMKVDPETYVSNLINFYDERADAKGCKYRSSKQMAWHAKRTLPQNCRWRSLTMSIEGFKDGSSVRICMHCKTRAASFACWGKPGMFLRHVDQPHQLIDYSCSELKNPSLLVPEFTCVIAISMSVGK